MNPKLKGLIVSDNPALSQFVIEIASTHDLPLDLAFTRSLRTGRAMELLGAKQVDIKSQKCINEIIARYDFILSVHCQQIFLESLYESVACFNLHPGLNPHNRGWYPQVFSILNNLPIGATLHRINSRIDGGPVVTQMEVPSFSSDTSLEIYNRIHTAEQKILLEMLPKLCTPDFKHIETPIFEGTYNSKEDFRKLCCLNLNHNGTLKEHIDLLRALTHGDFKNAYYVDEHGDRVYIKIKFEKQ